MLVTNALPSYSTVEVGSSTLSVMFLTLPLLSLIALSSSESESVAYTFFAPATTLVGRKPTVTSLILPVLVFIMLTCELPSSAT